MKMFAVTCLSRTSFLLSDILPMRSSKSRRRWRRTASAIKPRLRWAGAPPSGGFCKESRRLRESAGPRSTGAQVASGAQRPAAVDGGPATGHQPFGQVVGQIVSRRLVAGLNKNNTLHPASQPVSRGERSYGAHWRARSFTSATTGFTPERRGSKNLWNWVVSEILGNRQASAGIACRVAASDYTVGSHYPVTGATATRSTHRAR